MQAKNDDGIKPVQVMAGGEALPVAVDESVAAYVQAATAANSRRAYQADLKRFLAWGGTLPATPEQIAGYLAAHAQSHAPATLSRWTVSLGRAHTTQGLGNPCKSELVRMTLRGIRRQRGVAQRQVQPALRDELIRMVGQLDDGPLADRDRALLLIGFGGALRRSELVSLTLGDLVFSEQGVTITLQRSKTDQEGAGRRIGIPFARGSVCPVKALAHWLNHHIYPQAGMAPEAPVFRGVNRHGQVAERALSDRAVAKIVKRCVQAVGLDPESYAGHSLRAGFCTSAALAGSPHWKIKKVSGHRTHVSLDRYIRDARLFADNPLEGLF